MKSASTRFIKSLMMATLLTITVAAAGAPAPQRAEQVEATGADPTQVIQGKWQATIAGKIYTLQLRVEEGDLLGTVVLPNRKTVEIEDGICVSDEFSFTTVEDEVEWEWSGRVSESGLEGERERFDTDRSESFAAKRLP